MIFPDVLVDFQVAHFITLGHGKDLQCQQERIPAGCQLLTCRPYVLQNEQIWTCVCGRGVPVASSNLNKFEHVQGPVHGGGGIVCVWGGALEPCIGAGSLCGEIQCIMGNGHVGPPWEQNDTTETIASRSFVGGR